ncbi:MAG: hypothetical protein V4697_01950 [Patescibacteria group bacterium]
MKTKLSFLLVLICTTSILGAADQALLSIGSLVHLRLTALDNVVRGVWRIESTAIDSTYENSQTIIEATGSGAEQVVDRLCQGEPEYRLLTTNATITGYLYLYDVRSNVLWFAAVQWNGAEDEAGLEPDYSMTLMYQPLFSGVQSAHVNAFDSTGNIGQIHSLEVTESTQLLWPPFMCGSTNTELVVYYTNGSVTNYKVSDPVPKSLEVQGVQRKTVSFEGANHYRFNVQSHTNIGGTYTKRPTFMVSVTNGQYYVGFDVCGIVYINGQGVLIRPTRIYFLPPGVEPGSPGGFDFPMDQNGPTYLLVSTTYRIYFEWDPSFNPPQSVYAGPTEEEPTGVGSSGIPIAEININIPPLPLAQQ